MKASLCETIQTSYARDTISERLIAGRNVSVDRGRTPEVHPVGRASQMGLLRPLRRFESAKMVSVKLQPSERGRFDLS